MRLSALVETARGGLVPVVRLPAGDPEIGSVVTTDLLDPGRYLSGGELVLTGLAWWRPDQPARSRGFVAALVAAGAAALAAGEAEFGTVPADLTAACVEAGLPLLRVPVEISFAAISELAARPAGSDLAGVLARRRALVAAVAQRDEGLAAVVELVGAELGLACRVLSPTGRVIAGGSLTPALARPLARAFLRAARLPLVVRRGDQVFSLFEALFEAHVGAQPGARAAGWVLAVESDHERWREARLAVVTELAALVGLELDLARRRSDVDSALAAALAGTDPDAVVAAAARCGLDPGAPAVVAIGSGDLALPVLAEALAGHPAALSHHGGTAVAVAASQTSAGVVTLIRSTLDALRPGQGTGTARIGVSDAVTGGAGLLGAIAEARAAGTVAGPWAVAGPELLSSHALLLAAVPAELAAAYRGRVLGPLVAHDRRHRTALVATLRTYLECSGSWSRCAALMHLHVNTLRYRIERIEALTNRDLRRLDHQTDLLLALHVSQDHHDRDP